MALPSNDINDLNRGTIIESSDVSGQPGIVVLNADGTALGAPVGGSTSANQTNGSQKTQIVDAGGEVATVTGGKLDVNATASLAGEAIPISGATTAVGVAIVDGSGNQITSFGGGTQYTEGDTDASITGTVSMMEVAANTLQPVQGTVADGLLVNLGANNDVTVSGVSTSANQTTIIGHLDGVEGLLTTIDADTGTIATEVAGLLTDAELRATPVPISGTITANLSATDNAVLDAIEADTTTLAGAVKAEDSAHSSTDTGIMALGVRSDTLTSLAGTTGDYTTFQFDNDGALWIADKNCVIDSGNSTTTPLGISGTFTGTGVDTLAYEGITVSLFADKNSTANGMKFQFSTDNSNWDIDVAGGFDYIASTGRQFQFAPQSRYFRVVFTNTNSAQGAFRVQTTLHQQPITLTSVHRLDADVKVDRSATLVKAGLIAQINGTGDFTPIQANSAGVLKIGGSVTIDAGTANIGDVDVVSSALPTGASTLAEQQSQTTALQLIDNAVDGNYLNVNMNVAGTDVVSGSGTATGALRVELPTNGTGVIATVGAVTAITNALPAGTNAIGKLAANSGVDIGDVDVTSISAGSNLIGDVSLQPRTANGCTIFRSLDLDETEEEIKATAGNVYGYYFYNKAATAMYLKFYNATAANVTVGTTTPVLTMGLPAGAAGHVGLPYAPSFGTAITAAVTTGIADADTGAPAANDVSINVFFK